MLCLECGESAREQNLRYCEHCGAKMPPLPAPGSVRRTGARPALSAAVRTTGTRRALSADGSAPPVDRAPREAPRSVPQEPPYDGPFWLAHVPAHSTSVLGVGFQAAALVLSILPFFAGVGPLGSVLVIVGGWLLVARELRAVGGRHPLVDWVPESLVGPVLPALYTVLSVALAIRMLGLGITPLFWLLGAVLIGVDQYRKVYAGEDGWSRYFEPRQLLRGLAPVALGGVVLCLVSLFLVWVPSQSRAPSRAAPGGPPELRMMDQTPASSDVVYNLLDMPTNTGWDQPLSLVVALGLLGILSWIALRPEVPRPDWLRFSPVAVVLLSVAWLLFGAALAWGPGLFLVGLLAAGFVGVYTAFSTAA